MGINANYMTLNPLYLINNSYPPATNVIRDGNLTLLNATSNYGIGMTHSFFSGKWYWEILLADKGQFLMGFITVNTFTNQKAQPHNTTGSYLVYTATASNGNQGYKVKENNFITINNFNAGDGDIIGFALDRDARKLWVSLNGTFINSGDPAGGSNPVFDTSDITATAGEFRPIIGTYGGQAVKMTLNAGQDSSFVNQKTSGSANATDGNGFGDFYYTPPTGFLSPCSNNIPISDDIDPAGDNGEDENPTKQFFISQYVGNGTGRTVTTENQADFIWIRQTNYPQDWSVLDSNRGITDNKYYSLNKNDAEATLPQSNFTSVGATSVGISSGTKFNSGGHNMQLWMWHCNSGTTTSDSSGDITVTRQTNDASKFTIATWTGNGSSGSTIAHGLGVAPSMTWIKKRNATASTNVWHVGFDNGDYDSFGEPLGSAAWYANQGVNGPFSAAPGTDYLTLTAYAQVNGSSDTYVGYFWADVDGMQRFGKYIGNGNSDGPFVYTGFRPAVIFLKRTDDAGSWQLHDNKRDTHNPVEQILLFNTTDAQFTSGGDRVDFLSNGFKLRHDNAAINASGGEFVYGAWADVPFKYNNTF